MGNYIARALIDNYYYQPIVKPKSKSKYVSGFKEENMHFDYKTGKLYPTQTCAQTDFKKEKRD